LAPAVEHKPKVVIRFFLVLHLLAVVLVGLIPTAVTAVRAAVQVQQEPQGQAERQQRAKEITAVVQPRRAVVWVAAAAVQVPLVVRVRKRLPVRAVLVWLRALRAVQLHARAAAVVRLVTLAKRAAAAAAALVKTVQHQPVTAR
jgi:hypothetical protein